MKKVLMFLLNLLSLFLFVLLAVGVFSVVKDVIKNNEGLAYNFGYCLGALGVFALFFWLNIKLYKFSGRKE